MKKLAFLATAAALSTASVSCGPMPRRVLIRRPGRYRSPTGHGVLDVWAENGGKLKFSVRWHEQGRRSRCGPVKAFQPGSDWFMCWDFRGRLWAYVPEHGLRLCRYLYSTTDSVGSCTPGEFGGWEGIPEPFLARLPERVKKVHARYAERHD